MRVAVLRTPEGLVELAIERARPFQPPAVVSALDDVGPYVETALPADLARLEAGRELDDAMTALRRVEAPGADVLVAALRLLLHTTPDPGAFGVGLAPPRLPTPPPRRRRTAAHPRGYRGTKHRPPQPPRGPAIDALPYLDGGGMEAALLEQLAGHADEALAALADEAPTLAARGLRALRPLAQAWPADVGERLAGQPATWRRAFLWAARGLPWADLAELIAASWAIGLDGDDALLRMAALVLAQRPGTAAIAWLRQLERVAPHRRRALAELLVETRVACAAPPPAGAIERADALCDDHTFRHRVHHLLDSIAAGDAAGYVLDGIELANAYEPHAELRGRGDADGALAAVRTVMAVVDGADDAWPGFALHLWDLCGRLDGFAPLIARLPWTRLDPDSAWRLARLLGAIALEAAPGEEPAVWRCVAARAEAILELVAAAPPPFRLAIDALLFWVGMRWNRGDALARALDRALAVAPRLGGPPFDRDGSGYQAAAELTALDDDAWARVAAAPDASFRRLAGACRRENDEGLITHGLAALADGAGDLVARGFAACPGALIDAARSLGALPLAAGATLIADERRTPLFTADPAALDPAELVRLIDGTGAPSTAALVPRTLRAHVRGEATLRPAQLARARALVAAAWDQVLLARLAAAVPERTARSLGAPPPATAQERHALLFLTSAGEHRRALRRVLRAHLTGEARDLADHPVNRRWLARHPRIDPALWTRGIALRRTSDRFGEVTLSIERDPLEVLRLGTYVGSCLGLGGGLRFSAVAILLDVNKQVVYCRGRGGVVLGRQILALTEQERLCCFPIYPLGVAAELEAMFLDYDRALAAALGVAVVDPDADGGDPADDVARLVSQDWWHDDPIQVPGV